jgi:RNA polymerase sigma-70 factor (ECF subfamily)
LRAEWVHAGKAAEFDRLSIFLNNDSGSVRYETVAAELGVSAGALRMTVHRMRRTFRRLLRAEIADTVDRPEEIDDELRFLLSVLSA